MNRNSLYTIKIIILGLIVGANPNFAQTFGLGIILGSPTGFTGKVIFTKNSAFAVNLGWSLGEHPRLHITGDYQFLFPTVLRWQDDMTGEQREIKSLTPFLGIGGRMKIVENDRGEEDLHLGMRLGGGAEYQIHKFGIFLEIYPVVNIYPSTDFDLEGGLGCRFYF